MHYSNRMTTDPLSSVVDVPSQPEFMRLPRHKQRDPVFGLSRGFINFLVLPSKANGNRPPVSSIVLRQRGAKTGVRLVEIASLRAYLQQHREPNSGQDMNVENKDIGAEI